MNFTNRLRYGFAVALLLSVCSFSWGQQTPAMVVPSHECALSFETETVGVFCNEGTGEIVVTISGGTPPFRIEWDGSHGVWGETNTSSRSFTIDQLAAGIYNVYVQDEFGCYVKENNICLKDQVSTMDLSLAASSPCEVLGSIEVQVGNSSPPYWVILDGPIEKPLGFHVESSEFSIQNLSISGAYQVTVRKEDCERTESINIVVSPGQLALDLSRRLDVKGGVETNITGGHAPFRIYHNGPTKGLTHSDGGTKLVQNLAAGEYEFIVIDAEMCEVRQTIVVRAEDAFIANIETDNQLTVSVEKSFSLDRVFPNPAIDQINFSLSGITNATVSIKDLLGRTLIQTAATNNQQSVSIGHLEQGVYLLEVSNGVDIKTQKFIKK